MRSVRASLRYSARLHALALRQHAAEQDILIGLDHGDYRYRYENVDSDFTADLPLGERGLVLDYPGLFRRVWPA